MPAERCHGKSRQTGEPCKKYVVKGRKYCRYHGGKNVRGIAHPNYQGKGRSLDVPTQLMADYLASRDDPEILSLRSDIALIDARMNELLKRTATGESGHLWRNVKTTLSAFKEANDRNNVKAAGSIMRQLLSIIDSGIADYDAWAELREIVDTRRKLVESERKRLTEMNLMVTANEAALLVRSLVLAVNEHVTDPTVLRKITESLDQFAFSQSDQRHSTG